MYSVIFRIHVCLWKNIVMAANIGAFAPLNETGYLSVFQTKDTHQLCIYLKRLFAYHGGVVTDTDALLSYSFGLLDGMPIKKLDEIVAECSYLHFVSMPSVNNPEEDKSSNKRSSRPKAEARGEGAKAKRNDSSGGTQTFPEGSCSAKSQGKIASSDTPAERSVPTTLEVVRMDGFQFCSEPFENLGALIVTAPPWSPYHIVSARIFSLVLRSPLDPSRGIVLAQHEDQAVVSSAGNGIVNEMGGIEISSRVLSSPEVYESLRADSTLISLLFSGPEHLSSFFSIEKGRLDAKG